MGTITQLVFSEQFGHLGQIANHRNWFLEQTDTPGFILGLPARDGSIFFLKVDCDNYPQTPPAWHWYNHSSNTSGKPSDIPQGTGGYFHNSGCICAPWNRLAYKQIHPNGPHSDWELSNWLNNSYTGACKTLSAMALRIAVELSSSRYQRRAA